MQALFVKTLALVVAWVGYSCCVMTIIREPGPVYEHSVAWDWMTIPYWLETYLPLAIYVFQVTWLVPLTCCHLFAFCNLTNTQTRVKSADKSGEGFVKLADNTDGDMKLEDKTEYRLNFQLVIYSLALVSLTMSNMTYSQSTDSQAPKVLCPTLLCLASLVLVYYVIRQLVHGNVKKQKHFRHLPQIGAHFSAPPLIWGNESQKWGSVLFANGLAAIATWIVIKLDLFAIKCMEREDNEVGVGKMIALGIICAQIITYLLLDKKLIDRGYSYLFSPTFLISVALFGFSNFRSVTCLGILLPVMFGFYLILSVYRLGYMVHRLMNKAEYNVWTVQTNK